MNNQKNTPKKPTNPPTQPPKPKPSELHWRIGKLWKSKDVGQILFWHLTSSGTEEKVQKWGFFFWNAFTAVKDP